MGKKLLKHYLGLEIGSDCPKCELGKGLEESSPIEIMLSGWENYDFLHCPICGQTYVGRSGDWIPMDYRPPELN